MASFQKDAILRFAQLAVIKKKNIIFQNKSPVRLSADRVLF